MFLCLSLCLGPKFFCSAIAKSLAIEQIRASISFFSFSPGGRETNGLSRAESPLENKKHHHFWARGAWRVSYHRASGVQTSLFSSSSLAANDWFGRAERERKKIILFARTIKHKKYPKRTCFSFSSLRNFGRLRHTQQEEVAIQKVFSPNNNNLTLGCARILHFFQNAGCELCSRIIIIH